MLQVNGQPLQADVNQPPTLVNSEIRAPIFFNACFGVSVWHAKSYERLECNSRFVIRRIRL